MALTLWITGGRSRAARLIYSGLALLGAAGLLYAYHLGYDVALFFALRLTIELTLLIALLWWPATTDWLGKPSRPVTG